MLDKDEIGGADDGREFEIPEVSVAYENFGMKNAENESESAVSPDMPEEKHTEGKRKKSKAKTRTKVKSERIDTAEGNEPSGNAKNADVGNEEKCVESTPDNVIGRAVAAEPASGTDNEEATSSAPVCDTVFTATEDGESIPVTNGDDNKAVANGEADESSDIDTEGGEKADIDSSEEADNDSALKIPCDDINEGLSEEEIRKDFPDNAFGIDENITSYIEVTDGLGDGELEPRVIPEDIFPDDALVQTAPSNTDGDNEIDLLGDVVETVEDVEDELKVDDVEAAAPSENGETAEDTEDEVIAPVPEETYNPEKPRRIDAIFDFVELLIFTLAAVLIITSFFVKHAVVDGGSMNNTLSNGDVLVISDFFYTPERGDIVVIEDHTTALKKPIVKRVIALGGDRVTVKADGIYIGNDILGEPLDEPYVFIDFEDYIYNTNAFKSELRNLKSFHQGEDYYSFTVPEGELFVLGDHRNDSTDSRVIGTVTVDAVLGKVLFRIMPFDKFGEIPE